MEDSVGPCLFESLNRRIHSLSGGGESAAGQHLDLLRVSDFGLSVNNLLSCFEEFLSEVSKL